ncbi:MAG: GatB/YqeY domain-containing protein [Pseudomonadota bacterium]|nr:GatB/YqeY domain-containing protein [Pseudomonadota bacterium]
MPENSIKNKIKLDLVAFMKSGNKEKVDIIRFIMSFINQEEKEKKKELSDGETLKILKKLIKKNQDAYGQFIKAKRNDLADKEKKEMDLIEDYLPEELDESKIVDIVKASIKSTGAQSVKDIGAVMSDIKKNNDAIDLSVVSKHVKNLLS